MISGGRAPLLCSLAALLIVAFFARFALVDVPAEWDRLRFERTVLWGTPNEKRRVEMFRPWPGSGRRPEAYFGVRRYLAFMRAIRRATPPHARIALVGVESSTLSLERFAHYYLYPRLPIPMNGQEAREAERRGEVDAVARFHPDGRTWEIRLVRR